LRHADQDLRVDDVPDGFEDELAATAGPARGAIFLTGPWHLTRVSHADRVYGVHVADRREPIRSDFDRGLPGDGSRAAVSDDGTFGDAFPDSLWALPAEEIARRAVESMEAL
jgi:hypothetical protein